MTATADSIVLRQAVAADVAAIGELVRGLTLRWIAPDCEPDGVAMLLESMADERTRERLRHGHVHVVAVMDGRIVGVGALRLPAHLYWLFVAEAAQRRGVARRLWEALRAHVPADATVTVNASRHAVPAYARLGFEAVDTERSDRGLRYTPMLRRPG